MRKPETSIGCSPSPGYNLTAEPSSKSGSLQKSRERRKPIRAAGSRASSPAEALCPTQSLSVPGTRQSPAANASQPRPRSPPQPETILDRGRKSAEEKTYYGLDL
ncbi:MAG: hypothetical protein IJQ39_12255 [Thermoguttaceae bacterium]|nr:hypothetical protein [Thermoguttaceae bacterium]